jgi:hypothetical protein
MIRKFITNCFADPKDRPSAETLLGGDLVREALRLQALSEGHWEYDRVVTVRRAATEAMFDCAGTLCAEWARSLESSKSGSSNKGSAVPGAQDAADGRTPDLAVLLSMIIGMISDAQTSADGVK